jgi:hypothetical protein
MQPVPREHGVHRLLVDEDVMSKGHEASWVSARLTGKRGKHVCFFLIVEASAEQFD